MDEWQPARVIVAHGPFDKSSEEVQEKILRQIVHVRPSSLSEGLKSEYRKRGCDSSRFFEVNPEDIKWHRYAGIFPFICCEHEILSD